MPDHARRASVAAQRFGAHAADRLWPGRWDRIEPLITAALSEYGIAVTVYDFA